MRLRLFAFYCVLPAVLFVIGCGRTPKLQGVTSPSADDESIVVGSKYAYVFNDANLKDKETILPLGYKVPVLEVQNEGVKISTVDDKEKWMLRCDLCRESELKKRQSEGYVPLSTVFIVSEGGRIVATRGTMIVTEGGAAPAPGRAIWCNQSVEPKVGFKIGGSLLAYKPNVQYFLTKENKSVELTILEMQYKRNAVRESPSSDESNLGAKDTIVALTELARDKESEVRNSAVWALGKMGPTAIPALTELLRDKNLYVRESAAEALGKMGPAAVPALTKLLRDKDSTVRLYASAALRRSGQDAKTAIPALTELLQDKEGMVRTCAARALGGIGSDAKAAIPALMELLRDKEGKVRSSAAEALGEIGPDARTAIPALLELLRDSDC